MSRVPCLIITALPEERDAVATYLGNLQKVHGPEGLARAQCYEGILPDGDSQRTVIVEVGEQGRVPAAMAATSAIQFWNPEFVLLVGIAGGIHSRGVRLGDVVVAERVLDYEDQRIQQGSQEIHPKTWPADSTLSGNAVATSRTPWSESIKVQRPEDGTPQFWSGTIASGDKFVRDDAFISRLRSVYPDLVAIEKEAGGVAWACAQHRHRPRFITIRAISDYAEPTKGSPTFCRWRQYACHAAAALAIQVALDYMRSRDVHAPGRKVGRAGSGRSNACWTGMFPGETSCCHFGDLDGDMSSRWPDVFKLARPVARLCRRRLVLGTYAVIFPMSAMAFRFSAGSSFFINLTLAAGIALGLTFADAWSRFVGVVADGIALKTKILAGNASDGEVEEFLAVADGLAFLPGKLSSLFRRGK